MFAPKAPKVPAPPPPEPPAPIFTPGSELDTAGMANATSVKKTGKSALKTHSTGLSIPGGSD